MLEWLPRKRAILALLGVFFLVSVISLLSSLFPSETGSWTTHVATTHQANEASITTTAAAAAPQSDEEEEEEVVNLDTATKPTPASQWKPKTFERPSDAVMKLIEMNVRKYKNDKILLTAVANKGMAEYTLNWIESLKRTKQDDKFLVFSIDQELQQILSEHGYADHVVEIPESWYHKQLSSDFSKWLDSTYTPITHGKTLVVERLLYLDITVWFSDVDIVFTSPFIYDYLTAKLSSRKAANRTKSELTELLISQEREQSLVNSGFYIMRPTDTNKRLLDDTIRIQDNEPDVTQQMAMNRVLLDMNLSYHSSPIALLDLALFPHGRLFFEQNVPAKYGLEPMIVHANYRVGDNKKQSLQQAKLWYID